MRLRELQITPFTLKLRAPVQNAKSTLRKRSGFLLRLIDEDGRRGYGESTPLSEFGTEDVATAAATLKMVSQQLLDRPVPSAVEEVEALVSQLEPLQRAPASRFGVELALLDLASQRAGVPLARFLNATARPQVEVNALLVARESGLLAQEAAAAVREGYPTVKVKVAGRSLSEDAKRLIAVRREVGDRAKIRIDANGMWTEAEAATALRGLSPLRIELCEQPVAADDYQAMRRLRRLVPCPIAADESLGEPDAFEAILNSEDGPIVDILVLKPAILGGVLPALRLSKRADELGLGSYVTSAIDGVVARLGQAHLAAALPKNGWACGLGVDRLFEQDLGPNPCAPRAGSIQIPDRPGLGLEPNWSTQLP
jgi:o-succinylbenzoate synthase